MSYLLEACVRSTGFTAVAALAVALGATDEEIQNIYPYMMGYEVPNSPAEAVVQVREALERMRQ